MHIIWLLASISGIAYGTREIWNSVPEYDAGERGCRGLAYLAGGSLALCAAL